MRLSLNYSDKPSEMNTETLNWCLELYQTCKASRCVIEDKYTPLRWQHIKQSGEDWDAGMV